MVEDFSYIEELMQTTESYCDIESQQRISNWYFGIISDVDDENSYEKEKSDDEYLRTDFIFKDKSQKDEIKSQCPDKPEYM